MFKLAGLLASSDSEVSFDPLSEKKANQLQLRKRKSLKKSYLRLNRRFSEVRKHCCSITSAVTILFSIVLYLVIPRVETSSQFFRQLTGANKIERKSHFSAMDVK